MKKLTNTRLAVSIMLFIEIVSIGLQYKNRISNFNLSETFFTWGLIEVLLGLTLIFGFENKMINNAFTKSGNENYIQNVSNYVGASTKNFFKRDNDMSAGGYLLLLGIVNLVIYAFMLL